MVRLTFTSVAAAVFGLTLSHPTEANEIPQREKVAQCLSQHGGDPVPCLGVILSPCAHQSEIGFGRACYAKLGRTWVKGIRSAKASDPRLTALKSGWPSGPWVDQIRQSSFDDLEPTCQAEVTRLAQGRELDQHEVRNACYLMEKTHWWYRTAHTPDDLLDRRAAFLADVESLEACLLESGAAGHADQCIDLFSGNCDTAHAHQHAACRTFARLLWYEVLINAVGVDRAAELHSESGTAITPELAATCGNAASCIFKDFALRTIDAFLAAELR